LPVEQIDRSGNVLYYHHDQQGSTTLLTNSTGTVVGSATYTPSGIATWNFASTNTATTPLAYDGQYTDPDSGLIYLRARWYDPDTAQFTTRDPLEAITGAPYEYAGDNPLNSADLLGQAPTSYTYFHYTRHNIHYDYRDEYGELRVQIKYNSDNTANLQWSYVLSSELQSLCDGEVSERADLYQLSTGNRIKTYRDDHSGPRAVPRDYLFHSSPRVALNQPLQLAINFQFPGINPTTGDHGTYILYVRHEFVITS
jgi:RHS repeat-associated protein